MKKLISFLFLFGMIGGVSLSAQSTHTANTHTSTTEKIIIKETGSMTPVLKSMPAVPVSVEAWLTAGQVDILFQGNFGTVTITVTGAQNEVYQASVPATDGTEITISTQGWPAGAYTITIVRSSGQTLTGDFEL